MVYIVDRSDLDKQYFEGKDINYIKCDLKDFDIEIFRELAKDKDIEALMITAGFGRVARFEYIDDIEIKNQMQVNSVSIMQIIKAFYVRILSENMNFYTGIMVSIARRISSTLFSTYSASKHR